MQRAVRLASLAVASASANTKTSTQWSVLSEVQLQGSLSLQLRWFSLDHQARAFRDKVRVQVKGGDGGNGCSSFERTRDGIGQPNGGNGGRGGNVYLRTVSHQSAFALSTFHFNGRPGKNGGSDLLNGATGEDVFIDIPAGTERPTAFTTSSFRSLFVSS